MKTKAMMFGAGVVALAGGVMFCGEDVFVDDPPDTVTHEFNNQDPTLDEPFRLSITLARAGMSMPAYWALKVDGLWEQPKPEDGKLAIELPSAQSEYSLVAVCESTDARGLSHVRTTVIEATGRELPAPIVGCATTRADETMQMSGVIRNVDRRAAVLSIGARNEIVPNPKAAKDVLFGTTAPAGLQSVVASVGDSSKEKTRVSIARNVNVVEGTAVELDMARGGPLQPHVMSLSTDVATRLAGGAASLWVDGRTRLHIGEFEASGDGVGIRSTLAGTDLLDVRAEFRGPALLSTELAPIARARFLTRADVETLTVPGLAWVGPSFAHVTQNKIAFGWSTRNWAVFGKNGDDLALFAPVAYVANLHFSDNATHDLTVAVTPNRVRGATPHYELADLSRLPGWLGRWSFPAGQPVEATSGNLSAYAGVEAPDPGAAIAAYADREHKLSPAQLGINTLTIVAAGSPVTTVAPTQVFGEVLDNRCFEQRPCSAKIDENVMAVEMCPDTAAYNDCREDPADRWKASKADFVRDLEREVLAWYHSGAEIPNARSAEAALENISEERVQIIEEREGEWWTYDPGVYQLYWHPDPTRESSSTIWYGAYLAGRLVSIYPVNWDATMPDGDVDYCRLRIKRVTAVQGVPSNPIMATVHVSGVTEGFGQGSGVEMQLGWGQETTDDAYADYTFTPMRYNGDVDRYAIGTKTDDQYFASVTIDEVGTHRYIARVRRDTAEGWTYCDFDGSFNGVDPAQLGTATVREPGQQVDECSLTVPQLIDDATPHRTLTFRAHVFEKGMTGSQSMDSSLVGQLLVGQPGADPSESVDDFMIVPARPAANVQLEDGRDEYLAAFAPPKHGTYAFAYRFSADGGVNWTTCGLQDHEQPTAEFTPQKMGVIVASLPANFVDHCVVTSSELAHEASSSAPPEVSVLVHEPEITVNDGGTQSGQIEVQALVLPLEHNPALSAGQWQPLDFVGEQPEKYQYGGSLFTDDGPGVGTYSAVVRVRRLGSSYWRYCDADPDNDRFTLDRAARLTITP